MLLLAAVDQLKEVLQTRERLGDWRQPVEDQNGEKPPKEIIDKLFRAKHPNRREYRDTTDAPNVLKRVSDLREVVYRNNRRQCPEFLNMLNWLGDKTGVPVLTPST